MLVEHALTLLLLQKNQQEIARVHKALLPTYDVFDDLRYFEAVSHFEPVVLNNIPFGITICEDIWFNDNEIQYHTYKDNPAEILEKKGARAIINISASPYSKINLYLELVCFRNMHESCNSLFYVNQVGANTELIFDGDSLALAPDGYIVTRGQRFKSTYVDVEYNAKTQS